VRDGPGFLHLVDLAARDREIPLSSCSTLRDVALNDQPTKREHNG
jgi:hypothetical protein